jgi:hypothetical protein
MDLLTHLQTINAETQKWIDADSGRWATKWTEDLEHWHEMAVYSVEHFNKYVAIATYSDTYKELYGHRPSLSVFSRMTLAEMELELESVFDEIAAQNAYEHEMDAFMDEMYAEEQHVYNLTNSEPLPYEEYDV